MDTSIAPNPSTTDLSRVSICYDRSACFLEVPDNRAVNATNCDPNVPHLWSWESETAQLLTVSGGYCGRVRIEYGRLSEGCIDFRGKNGLALEPFNELIEIKCAG